MVESSSPAGERVAGIGPVVLVRGAGDFATGIIHRLHSAGFEVVATELESPLAVRRGAALSEAVYEGTYTVEGVTAELAEPEAVDRVLSAGRVPVVVDPEGEILLRGFDVVVDARSAKRNLGTGIGDAPVVVAIGPGFEAGVDCHAVVETLPGKGVGRVIYSGSAAPDTKSPDPLEMTAPRAGGIDFDDLADLVFRAPISGVFSVVKPIGSEVEKGDVLGSVSGASRESREVISRAGGIVRGIIRDGTSVRGGMKLGDIDPTSTIELCYMISEKSRAIAGGVLEACLRLLVSRGIVLRRP